MLINLRNALMSGKRLPYDAEVEYLESTGTQWIDTGLTVKSSLHILLDTQVDDICRIFGGRTASGSNQFDLFQYSTADIRPSYGNRSINVTGVGTGRHTFDFNQNTFSVDGVIKQTFTAQTFSAPSPIYIGALSTNNSGAISPSKLIGRIYSYKIWDNGTLVQNCIPVRKGTVGYLYDRVSGKLFGNAGTGDFVLGPDVVPVEYIESHGTQYIDTGFKANTTTTRLDIELMLTQSTVNMGLFGSRNASGTSGSSSCNAFFLSANQAFRMDWANGGGPLFNCLPNTAYSISITRGSVTINGSTTTYTNIDSVNQANNFLIFSFAEGSGVVYQNGMIGRVFGAKIYSNNLPVRSFRPVRVGTGSTWEGAMMDVLTRRIYRNAGTGAFTYGNDLKYPIPAA